MDIDEIIEYHSGPFSVVHHRGEQVAVLSNSGVMFFLGNKNACDLLNAYAALKAERDALRDSAVDCVLTDAVITHLDPRYMGDVQFYAIRDRVKAIRIAALEAALRDLLKAQTMTLGPRTAEIIRMAEEVLSGNPPLPEGK